MASTDTAVRRGAARNLPSPVTTGVLHQQGLGEPGSHTTHAGSGVADGLHAAAENAPPDSNGDRIVTRSTECSDLTFIRPTAYVL